MFSAIVKVKAARLIQNKQEYDVNALTDVCQLVVCQDLMWMRWAILSESV